MTSASGSSGSSIARLALQIYDQCSMNYSPDHLFYQQDLLNLGVIQMNDLSVLLQCTQYLVNQKLFRLLQKNDRLAWKVIPREDADKYDFLSLYPFIFICLLYTKLQKRLQNLSPDESLVYNVIHSTSNSGIWVRSIQTRTGLHKSILDRCLKSLEGKNYIKSVHNVKFPSRKMYMLAGLAPSEDVTGGAWFTDGVLDENFINSVAGFIEYTVSRKSWFEVSSNAGGVPRNKRIKTTDGKVAVKSEYPEKKSYLPFPAGYKGYPTVSMITTAVNQSGITPVRLGEESIVQLLEMLCYDNKLVAQGNGEFYRSLKTPESIKASHTRKTANDDEDASAPVASQHGLYRNGMTEAPCGQCPVFKLCAPGGTVSPETCEYFDAWLDSAFGF